MASALNTLPRDRRPRLYLESGRALVDEAGYLITSIVAVKQTNASGPITLAGKAAKAPAYLPESTGAAYVIDVGINILYSGNWYRFNVKPAKAQRESARQPVKLYGCLCMNIDVIRDQVSLPAMTTGDHLVMHPVGAYNITQSMQFITYRPAVVMIGLDGRVDVIREREDLDYVQRLERVPEHLLTSSRP
ncbi:MAG: hypothetical protein B7Z47_02345 [Chthoniobacter sp. 12-60-6]|nr:MAG: hypothetical protein B7Z47_02345 [Chthoniobacter sp. 12-60-6]